MFYGPLSIYLANAEEFYFSLNVILQIIGIVSIAVFAILETIGLMLKRKGREIFRKLLFGFFLAFYIQGNYINLKNGNNVLNGTSIEWNQYLLEGVLNTGLWMICIAFPWLLDMIIDKVQHRVEDIEITSVKIETVIVAFVMIMQVVAMGYQLVTFSPSYQQELEIYDTGEFVISAQNNTFVFVVDTLDQAYYTEFLENNPTYKSNLGGFVEYSNTATAGARTHFAIPAILTGRPYQLGQSYQEYLNDTWMKDNILQEMKSQNCDVRVYSETAYFDCSCVNYIDNFASESEEMDIAYLQLMKKIYKVIFFKFMPISLKRFFIVDTLEFSKLRKASIAGGLYIHWMMHSFLIVLKNKDIHYQMNMNQHFVYIIY